MIEWMQPRGTEDFELDMHPITGPAGVAARYTKSYGRVEFFFTAALPAELSLPEDIIIDDEDGTTDIALQPLAFVRKFMVTNEDGLLRKDRDGPLVVVHVKWIRDLIGLMKCGKKEYIVKRWHTLVN